MRRFYCEHHPKLLRFVARRVAGPTEAAEVCQEVWQVFFVKYDEYAAAYGQAVRLLYPIARYRIADFWRHHERIREAPIAAVDLVALADSLNVGGPGVHHGTDRVVDLKRALATLPPRQREALHLHYIDDLTVAQTATLMGVSENAVKNLLKRALEALRAAASLESYGLEGGSE
jgi:RNA polymerase sigma-70 factor (ECF subfamily)